MGFAKLTAMRSAVPSGFVGKVLVGGVALLSPVAAYPTTHIPPTHSTPTESNAWVQPVLWVVVGVALLGLVFLVGYVCQEPCEKVCGKKRDPLLPQD